MSLIKLKHQQLQKPHPHSGSKGEESGGVVQIADERRIKFVSCIRHAGLGAL